MDMNQLNNFAQSYYSVIETNPESLLPLYKDDSKRCDDNGTYESAQEVVKRLSDFKYKHEVLTNSSFTTSDSIIVVCTGAFYVEIGKPILFAETFQIVQHGGLFYIVNDVFHMIQA